MLIKNFKQLSLNKLRKDALEIVGEGLAAINTKKAITKNLFLKGNFLFIKGKSFDLKHYRKIFLLAVGKDAYAAAEQIGKILGNNLSFGLVLSQQSGRIPKMSVYRCTHPQPSEKNVASSKKVIDFIKDTTAEDLLLVVISGGGSAMLTSPYKISVAKKAAISEVLMDSGADIAELNTVRKHLSRIKGGRLASLAYPATVLGLVFSDVVGNDLSVIASGPMVLDHTTVEDAMEILNKYKVLEKLKIKNIELSESPKDPKLFQKTQHFFLLDNTTAIDAMVWKAKELGYIPKVFSDSLTGEAGKVGKLLLGKSKNGEALIAAGETTVSIKGQGEGGRCQEMVLENLKNIKDDQVLVAVGSDGHDHSDFAGAIGDKTTLRKATHKKIDPQKFLDKSNSFHFFKEVGDGINTGKLESNVADLILVLTKHSV